MPLALVRLHNLAGVRVDHPGDALSEQPLAELHELVLGPPAE